MKLIKKQTKNQGKMQLFCLPYAGGSSAIYRSWSNKLSQDIELYTINLPARAELFLEEPITDMNLLVDMIFEEITPYLHRPFMIFGHSMGGVIAYALARQIEQTTPYRACNIIISASKPPSYYFGKDNHKLSNAELKAKLIKHNATPQVVLESDELMELILPIYRGDLKLVESYNPSIELKLDTPLTLFNSLEDMPKEKILEWSDYFNTPANYHEFRGGHFFIHIEEERVISCVGS